MKSKHFYLLMVVSAIIFLGFCREFIFIMLNEKIAEGRAQLLVYKWICSFIFSVLFFLFTFLSLRLLFNDSHIKLVTICYASVCLISAAFHFIGSKNVAVLFMHMAQSPVILMALIPAVYLLKSEKK